MQNNYVKELAVKTYQEPPFKTAHQPQSQSKSKVSTVLVIVLVFTMFTDVLI